MKKFIIAILIIIILTGSCCACTYEALYGLPEQSVSEDVEEVEDVYSLFDDTITLAPDIEEDTVIPETEASDSATFVVTDEERYLLAALVFCEANTESVECQRAVVSVVFNRLACGKWGHTLKDVIFYPNAFTPASNGKIFNVEPNNVNFDAVDYVLKNGPTMPTYVRYFRTNYHFNWKGYVGYTVIDSTYFGYFKDWEKGAW